MCGDYIRNRLLEEICKAQNFLAFLLIRLLIYLSLVVQFVDIREQLGFVQCHSGTDGETLTHWGVALSLALK